MSGQQPDGQNRGLHRTITGSRVNLADIENLINAARVSETDDASSVSSSHTGGRSSNIIQIVPGKKNVKSAMQAALAEASGYGDQDDVDLENLNLDSDDEGYDVRSPSSPKSVASELKHLKPATVASEPLEGAGVTRRSYQESSAPPEGAGGYSAGEFIPPVYEDVKAPVQPKREPLGHGMHRTITGSSLRLAELNDLLEKANESECPGTPGSRGGKTPRSQSNMSLNSRSSSIVQIVPGVKDIRTALADAILEGSESSDSRRISLDTVDPPAGNLNERQGIGAEGGLSITPGSAQSQAANQAFGSAASNQRTSLSRPRSIRRLMSEKSFSMDTVYSGALLDEIPTDPLEGTGLVVGRKYQEPKHGPQGSSDSPRDFPRVVNGVPTNTSEETQRSSVPPSPMRKSGPYRTISGSNVDLRELESILEKATVPKSERMSLDGKSSYGGGTSTTHRSIPGKGLGVTHGSQVFGEELSDEPKSTFGIRAQSFNNDDLQDLIRKASVPRSEPDSPRSVSSSGIRA